MKHAKLMGMLTEEQYVQIVEANKYSSSASKSAGSSSSSLHSVSASSSSSSAPGTTSRSGRATTRHQQASGAAVSADEAHEAHTVSADDDNMEITSETTQTPSVSRRSSLSPSPSSSLLLPIEPSPRMTAAQSGGAVPARALAGAGVGVGVVSDMSAGTDGDSRDSADSLSKPLSVPVVIAVNANANTDDSASGGADEGLMSPSAKTRSTPSYSAPAKNAAPSVIMKTTSSDVNSKKVPATSTSTLTKTPALSKSSSSAAAPVAANAADNNKIKNSITSTAGAAGGRGGIGTNEMPKLAQLQAMLLATPAAALSSVTSSEKVKPAAKPILQQQTIKLAPAVQVNNTISCLGFVLLRFLKMFLHFDGLCSAQHNHQRCNTKEHRRELWSSPRLCIDGS